MLTIKSISLGIIGLVLSFQAVAVDVVAKKNHKPKPPIDVVPNPFEDQGSHFANLKTLYPYGVLPDENEIRGWWSGRCYAEATPSNPEAALLIAETALVPPSADNGPLFPDKPDETQHRFITEVVKSSDNKTAPNFYDSLSDQTIQQINDFLLTTDFTSVKTFRSGSAYESVRYGWDMVYGLRIARPYILVQYTATHTNGNIGAGDVFRMCYFFKKVHE